MAQLAVTGSRTDSGKAGVAVTAAQQQYIYYEHHTTGDADKPTIVLAHGWGMSLRIWDDTTSWLTDSGYSVLAFDQRNCGNSDKDFTDASIAALGSDLVALVDHLQLQHVVLNGWSLGGAVVVAAAPALGARMSGLISTCGATPRYTQAPGFAAGGTPDDVAATVAALRADRVNFLHGLYHEGVFVKPVSDAVKTQAHNIALLASPAADASLGALADIDQRDIMAALTQPALIIVGTDDGVAPADIGRIAADLLPAGRLLEMTGCGHVPFIEDPQAYRQAVGSFLDALPTQEHN